MVQGSKQRNWLLVGLIASLLLHAVLCVYFYRTQFTPLEELTKPPEQTVTFKVKNVDLQPLDKTSVDQTQQAAKPEPDTTNVQLPDEKKSFDQLLDDVHASAALPDDTRDVLPDTTEDRPDEHDFDHDRDRAEHGAGLVAEPERDARADLAERLGDVSGRPQPALTGTELATSTTIKRPNTFSTNCRTTARVRLVGRKVPGFSDLDSLLSQKGPLGSGTAIRMPNDQLFAYDSARFAARRRCGRPTAKSSATLIRRNPKATFTVEGYTDSFGSADYNYELSQRRADSGEGLPCEVRWALIRRRSQTRGYGASKFRWSPRAR